MSQSHITKKLFAVKNKKDVSLNFIYFMCNFDYAIGNNFHHWICGGGNGDNGCAVVECCCIV